MKKILGLDIGTTSIGWAIVEATDEKSTNKFSEKEAETDINNERTSIHEDAVGVRIISQDTERFDKGLTLNDPKGSTLTPTAQRRKYRGSRRMKSRYKLRRDKLSRVLSALGMQPDKAYYTNEKGKRGDYDDIGKAIYGLRNKAIKDCVSLNEMGRIFQHLNQWRGYSSDRFQKEEKPKFDYYTGRILFISESPIKIDYDKTDKTKINWLHYSIDIELEEQLKIDEENTINKFENAKIFVKEVSQLTLKKGDLITFKYELREVKEKGLTKEKYYKIQPTTPDPTDWNYKYQILQKGLTEWCSNGGTVGTYFYRNYYEAHNIQRIRNNVVNREWYEKEFDKILDTQFEYHKLFFDSIDIEQTVKVAFKDFQPILTDVSKKEGIKEQLRCLIKEKIIFFQRSWKQAKNKGQCPFEKIKVKKEITIKGTGKKELIEEYVGRTVIPRSHPLFQEFKIWQQINNVRIFLETSYEKIDLFAQPKVFEKYIGKTIPKVKQLLYDALQNAKTLSWKSFAEKDLGLRTKIEITDTQTGEVTNAYFNYNFRKQKKDGSYEDIKLKGNNTKVALQNILVDKEITWFNEIHSEKQSIPNLQLLWELIYDITNGEAIKVAAIIKKHFGFDIDICKQLACLKFDDAGVGSLSAKAIRQILPLMSDGKCITEKTIEKVNSLISLNNNIDEKSKDKDEKLESLKSFIPDKKARLKLSSFSTIADFTYLNYWEATAVRYGSHSTKKTNATGSIKPVERHSMNNPIVEKIVNETISIVNEIYSKYGFDEVRIELSRELKASMEERQQIWETMNNNAAKNEWAKQMLRELKAEFAELDTDVSNKSNLDKIKIIEDVVKFKKADEYKAKVKEHKLTEPSKVEVKKYLMWLEQNFRCPYTNQPIPFTDVFARGKIVEIEHIIPRERYYLDSYANKVITWKEVNQAKADYGNRTAYEFIVSKRSNEIIRLSNGIEVKLVPKDNWENHVKSLFPKGGKQANLLRKEIPEDPIKRTLKETQYINKKLKEKLGELVGEQKVWVTSGAVTDILRDRWHLNGIMKELMRNRFENFEIPTGKKTFKLKTIAEQLSMFDNLQAVLKNIGDFEVYKIQSGKKSIEIKDVDEIKKMYAELEILIQENTTDSNQKPKAYNYSTSDEAFETKKLTYYTQYFNTKSLIWEDTEIFAGYSKRLDHRHHVLDAIIIACTKQNHIQYINTLNAINNCDQESDESKKLKYKALKAEICTRNSSKNFKTPWEEGQFIPDVKKALDEVAVSHKNTRLLISPSKHRAGKDIKLNKIASIRGELHKETNYAKKNYFIEGSRVAIDKLLFQILRKKKENQHQTTVHFKTFEEIIKETILKEKYQNMLIPLFHKYEDEQLNDNLCKEYSKLIFREIDTYKLLTNSHTNAPLEWLSTYSDKDKSARPMGHSMDFNKPDIIEKIADPRIKRLAFYRLKYVNDKKLAIDKLDIDKKEKDKLKRNAETLPLYSNAIYEVRIRLDNHKEKIQNSEKPYKWIELKDLAVAELDKIWYGNNETTKLVKEKLKERALEQLKKTYIENPIFLSKTPIEVKKTSQLFPYELYEITKGRYVYAADVFMTYFFRDKNDKAKNAIRCIEFLKVLDAARIVSFEKPDKIDYSKLVSKPGHELVFTLAKNDLVYLPMQDLTSEQMEEIDWSDKKSISPCLFIVKDMNPSRNEIVFQQFYKADSIKISDTDARSLFSNPELKEQVEKIKYGDTKMWQRCIKVFTDKLGKKITPYWEFPNGCWNKEKAISLGLINVQI